MIKKRILVSALLMSAVVFAGSLKPFMPMPDTDGKHINAHGCGILFHDGLYYMYGEHKLGGREGFTAQVGVSCYSSPDLYVWKNEGTALAVSQESGSDIEKGCVIERPKVLYNEKTGKFVMWFHLELKGRGYQAARTAVAVADKPAGPFQFIRSLRPDAGRWPVNCPDYGKSPLEPYQVEAYEDKLAVDEMGECGLFLRRDFKGGQMSRDMTLFADDDGTAYHIHASEENQTLHISRLTDDYLDFTGEYVRVEPGRSNEAPAICKYDGKYYMITSGCTGWAPNQARSLTADNIFGPWQNTGNPCRGINPHNGLGPDKTWGAQSTFLLPIPGASGKFVAVFDCWNPNNMIDSRYLFLPAIIENSAIKVDWRDEWTLSDFTK
ncbi:MAG: glycoside hydrolase family 43 protein [Phycisphaerae bacterium]